MSQGKLNGLPPQVQQAAQTAGVTTTPQNPMTASAPNKPDPMMQGNSSTGNQTSASAEDMMAAMGKGLAQVATVVPPEINQQPGSVAPDGAESVAPMESSFGDTYSDTSMVQDGVQPAQPAPLGSIQPGAKQPTVVAPQTSQQLAQRGPQPITPNRPNFGRQNLPKPVKPNLSQQQPTGLSDVMRMSMISFINGTQYESQLNSVRNPTTGKVDDNKLSQLFEKAGGGSTVTAPSYQSQPQQPVQPQQRQTGSYWLNQVQSGAVKVPGSYL